MDILYAFIGFILGIACSYFWFLVGRNTRYQDQNVPQPPAPVELPKMELKPKEPTKPKGYVDDFTDPSMGDFHPGREL